MSVSLIRSLIPDLGDPPGLTDTQIEACLTLYPNVKLALAECLDILGSNEVLVTILLIKQRTLNRQLRNLVLPLIHPCVQLRISRTLKLNILTEKLYPGL